MPEAQSLRSLAVILTLLFLLVGALVMALGLPTPSEDQHPRRAGRGRKREVGGGRRPPRSTASPPIRVLRRREIQDARPGGVRVIKPATRGTSAPRSIGQTGIRAAASVPAHALCTWCGRPVHEALEAYGGAVVCPDCGYYSHRRCFEQAGKRCGGMCQLYA